jgi:hypothetical protein
MTRLNAALRNMHAYYVGENDDLDGFLSDLAILLGEDEDIASDIEGNLNENRELDGEDDEETA